MLQSALLAPVPGLAHGLTTRDDGSVGPASDAGALDTRWRAVVSLGGAPGRLAAPRQVHGTGIVVVSEPPVTPPDADGIVTTERELALMVQGADCPLIALVDPDAGVLGLVHSGWRGTVGHIAARAVATMASEGARPDRVLAAVFPGIGRCCFEVGPEVIDAMAASFGAEADAWHVPSGRTGHARLDLHAAIRATLRDSGVTGERVDSVAGCTACGDVLWSHRASGGGPERHGLFALLD